ncbi:MAG TPA: cytochrome P450, partial [Thermodesulfobacteriota bacterium]|nr:cytochrome P450 [Thermodesulfobacteriota bacterium]
SALLTPNTHFHILDSRMEAANKNYGLKNPVSPPGPKGLPYIGSLLDYFSDPLGFLTRIAEEYGDIVYFRLGSRRIYLLNNPDHIKDVLVTHNRNFTKSRVLDRAKFVLGQGLLTSEGDQHLRQRRIIQPVFHYKRIKTYGDVMAHFGSRTGEGWRDGDTVDIHREMSRLTLSVVSKTLFDADVESESDEIVGALNDLVKLFPRFLFPFSELLDYLPLPGNKKGTEAVKRLDSIIYRLIEERRTGAGSKDDLLSMLLEATDEEGDGKGMSDTQVRDEAITLFLAGQETMANSLTWTWYLLSQNPIAESKLHDEIDTVLRGRPPSTDDLGKLHYTHCVFKEALRIYPAAWTLARRAVTDYEAAGYTIPAGSDIYMSQYVIHRDARFFPNPLEFRPERWDTEDDQGLPKFAYFPFGGGPRRCIGEPFAWMEGVLLLASIASRWKMRLVPGHKVVPDALITIRPKYGMKMIVERR